jgi:endonuclease YncB( thermonuclease family)
MEANLRRKISNNNHTGFFVPAVLAGVILLTAGCGAKYEEAARNLDFLKYEYFTCSVVRVESGDSFFCEPPNMNMEKIRLAGVDVIPGREGEARKFSESILRRGTLVKVETGESVDTDGGPLSYVFVPGGKMLNVLLIENGYAEPVTEELNEKYGNMFPAPVN